MLESIFSPQSPAKVSAIIGSAVINAQGECLGTIQEVIIDFELGRIVYVVVLLEPFLCAGKKLFAIPFGTFKARAGKGAYTLAVAKERLAQAPAFDPDRWPSMSDEQWNRDIHAYYAQPPYGT